MIYQIAGAVIVVTCIICGTWYAVTIRQEKQQQQERERNERKARNERLFNDQTLALYQWEAARRQEAETREGIAKNQLSRARKEIDRLKFIIEELEAK